MRNSANLAERRWQCARFVVDGSRQWDGRGTSAHLCRLNRRERRPRCHWSVGTGTKPCHRSLAGLPRRVMARSAGFEPTTPAFGVHKWTQHKTPSNVWMRVLQRFHPRPHSAFACPPRPICNTYGHARNQHELTNASRPAAFKHLAHLGPAPKPLDAQGSSSGRKVRKGIGARRSLWTRPHSVREPAFPLVTSFASGQADAHLRCCEP